MKRFEREADRGRPHRSPERRRRSRPISASSRAARSIWCSSTCRSQKPHGRARGGRAAVNRASPLHREASGGWSRRRACGRYRASGSQAGQRHAHRARRDERLRQGARLRHREGQRGGQSRRVSPLTRLGSVFGTPAYMAPEQAAGQSVDHRADLYSLGLVLYEMVAGRAAFDSTDVVQLLAKQLTESPPPLPDTVDAEVASLVAMQLVEKSDPESRASKLRLTSSSGSWRR